MKCQRLDIGANNDFQVNQGAHGTVDLVKTIHEKIQNNESFCSYELVPSNISGTYERFFSDTSECEAIFYALTCHENFKNNFKIENFPSLMSIKKFSPNILVHLAAKGLYENQAEAILKEFLKYGFTNVFVVKGDNEIVEEGDFNYASDLVLFVRTRFGKQFSIFVAGYPEMHPKSSSREFDLLKLKCKVDAGADFVITQFFFESQLYVNFIKECQKIGIKVPIIPGIFPFTSTKQLENMARICKTNIPPWIKLAMEQANDDDSIIQKLGIDLSLKIIRDIRQSNLCSGYHLFTLNRSHSAVQIHRQLQHDALQSKLE